MTSPSPPNALLKKMFSFSDDESLNSVTSFHDDSESESVVSQDLDSKLMSYRFEDMDHEETNDISLDESNRDKVESETICDMCENKEHVTIHNTRNNLVSSNSSESSTMISVDKICEPIPITTESVSPKLKEEGNSNAHNFSETNETKRIKECDDDEDATKMNDLDELAKKDESGIIDLTSQQYRKKNDQNIAKDEEGRVFSDKNEEKSMFTPSNSMPSKSYVDLGVVTEERLLFGVENEGDDCTVVKCDDKTIMQSLSAEENKDTNTDAEDILHIKDISDKIYPSVSSETIEYNTKENITVVKNDDIKLLSVEYNKDIITDVADILDKKDSLDKNNPSVLPIPKLSESAMEKSEKYEDCIENNTESNETKNIQPLLPEENKDTSTDVADIVDVEEAHGKSSPSVLPTPKLSESTTEKSEECNETRNIQPLPVEGDEDTSTDVADIVDIEDVTDKNRPPVLPIPEVSESSMEKSEEQNDFASPSSESATVTCLRDQSEKSIKHERTRGPGDIVILGNDDEPNYGDMTSNLDKSREDIDVLNECFILDQSFYDSDNESSYDRYAVFSITTREEESFDISSFCHKEDEIVDSPTPRETLEVLVREAAGGNEFAVSSVTTREEESFGISSLCPKEAEIVDSPTPRETLEVLVREATGGNEFAVSSVTTREEESFDISNLCPKEAEIVDSPTPRETLEVLVREAAGGNEFAVVHSQLEENHIQSEDNLPLDDFKVISPPRICRKDIPFDFSLKECSSKETVSFQRQRPPSKISSPSSVLDIKHEVGFNHDSSEDEGGSKLKNFTSNNDDYLAVAYHFFHSQASKTTSSFHTEEDDQRLSVQSPRKSPSNAARKKYYDNFAQKHQFTSTIMRTKKAGQDLIDNLILSKRKSKRNNNVKSSTKNNDKARSPGILYPSRYDNSKSGIDSHYQYEANNRLYVRWAEQLTDIKTITYSSDEYDYEETDYSISNSDSSDDDDDFQYNTFGYGPDDEISSGYDEISKHSSSEIHANSDHMLATSKQALLQVEGCVNTGVETFLNIIDDVLLLDD